MNALDFEYDGLNLSDFGCVICTFDSIGTKDITMGSVVTFSTSYTAVSNRFMLDSTAYENCLEADFCICKNPCETPEEDLYFSTEEQRQIMRWLNRREYLPFRLPDDGYERLYYEASFHQIEKVEFAGEVIGLHLYLTTSSPFAFHDAEVFQFDITKAGGSYTIPDISDQIGYVYPEIEIICRQDGTLTLTNEFDKRVTEIENCSVGEALTMKNMMIESSKPEHTNTLMNDFNFVFPRISNKFMNHGNKLTFSLPCSVTLKYTPVMKVGV